MMKMNLFIVFVTILLLQVHCVPISLFDDQSGQWEKLILNAKPSNLPKQIIPTKSSDSTIFVGISHYRDGRCAETLKNLYSKAKFPGRVHVGIIQHMHTEEDKMDCRKDYCNSIGYPLNSGRCPHAENIKQIITSFKDARAPGVSRYMQNNLINNEDFCMQVDAHSDFAQHWDLGMLNTWEATSNEYAVISTRPPSINDPMIKEGEVNHLCQAAFTSK
jgi:hypothetical protein